MVDRKIKDNKRDYTDEDNQIEEVMTELGDTFKTLHINSKEHGKKLQRKKEDYGKKKENHDSKKEDSDSKKETFKFNGPSYGSTLFSR